MILSRREVVGLLGTGGLTALAGCGCEQFPEMYLRPNRSTHIGRVDGEWIVDGWITAEFVNIEGTLEDVVVTVFDQEGTEMARSAFGTFRSEDADSTESRCVGDLLLEDVRLAVPRFPYVIGVETAEPCRSDVTVAVAEFNDHYDPGHSGLLDRYWLLRPSSCEETPTDEPTEPTTTTESGEG